MSELPFHGQRKCEFTGCSNGGYFAVLSVTPDENTYRIYCGVHSRKHKASRIALEKDRQAKKKQVEAEWVQHWDSVEQARRKNVEAKRPGQVITSKLHMMRNPVFTVGFLPVWPNRRHQGKPGFGCASLSPMNLHAKDHEEHVMVSANGKIVTGCEAKLMRLPPALSIENYHQYAKCYDHEHDEQTGWPRDEFWNTLCQGYQDAEPHRHKYDRKDIARYSCRSDRTGRWRKFTYVESRFFYCKMYERRALESADFLALKQKLADGVNLEILGYDAFRLDPMNAETLYMAFQDGSRPFGHEMVLASLLVCADDLPWDRFFQAHPKLYEGFF